MNTNNEEPNKKIPSLSGDLDDIEKAWELYKKSPFYWSSYFYRIRRGPEDDIAAFELFCIGWEECRHHLLKNK